MYIPKNIIKLAAGTAAGVVVAGTVIYAVRHGKKKEESTEEKTEEEKNQEEETNVSENNEENPETTEKKDVVEEAIKNVKDEDIDPLRPATGEPKTTEEIKNDKISKVVNDQIDKMTINLMNEVKKDDEEKNQQSANKVDAEELPPVDKNKEAAAKLKLPDNVPLYYNYENKESIDDLISKIKVVVNPATNIEFMEMNMIIPTLLFWSNHTSFDNLMRYLPDELSRMYANTISVSLMGFPINKSFGTAGDVQEVCNIDMLYRIATVLKSGKDSIVDSLYNTASDLYKEYLKRCNNDKYYKLRQVNQLPILTAEGTYSNPSLVQIFGRNTYYKLEELFQDIVPPETHVFYPAKREGLVTLQWTDRNNITYYNDIDVSGALEGLGCPEIIGNCTRRDGSHDTFLVPIQDFGKGAYAVPGGNETLYKTIKDVYFTFDEVMSIIQAKNISGIDPRIYKSIDFTGTVAPTSEQFQKLKSVFDFIYSLDISAMIAQANMGMSGGITMDKIRFRLLDYDWDHASFSMVSDTGIRYQIPELDDQAIVNGLTVRVDKGYVSVYINGTILPIIKMQPNSFGYNEFGGYGGEIVR